MCGKQTAGERYRDLYLFRERTLRHRMTDLYISILTSKNAELLSKHNAELIRSDSYAGNELTVNCMDGICFWLGTLKDFCKNQKTYQEQFIMPIKETSLYLLDTMKEQYRTASIKGWVLAKSRPYQDGISSEERVTVSLLCPDLNCVLGVRIGKELASKMGYSMYELHHCKPIPLVNRIHQFRPVMSQSSETPSLAKYDFLKVSFQDMNEFSESIEMENFSEIASSHSKNRHNLGSVAIISCKIGLVRGPRIFLESVGGRSASMEAHLSEHYERMNETDIENLTGKYTRVLCILWYGTGKKDEEYQDTIEVLYVEEIADKGKALEEEVKGFVRLRAPISADELARTYPDFDPGATSIVSHDGQLSLSAEISTDEPITSLFLSATKSIRDIRRRLKDTEHVQVTIDDVCNQDKIFNKIILKILESVPALRNILVTNQVLCDRYGLASIQKLKEMIPGDALKRDLRWHRYVNTIEKTDHDYTVTSLGRKILSSALKDDVIKHIAGQDGLISLFKSEESGFPPSMVLEHLKNNQGEYRPFMVRENKLDLFWHDGPKTEALASSLFDKLSNATCSILLERSHTLATEKIMEELKPLGFRLGMFCTEKLLEQLGHDGILRKEGDSWEYPLENRIRRVLFSNKDKFISVDDIIRHTTTPTHKKEEVAGILAKLAEQDVVFSPSPGLWSFNHNQDERREQFILRNITSYARSIIRRRPDIDEANLIPMLKGHAVKFVPPKEREKYIRIALKHMIDSNEVILDDGSYRLP